LRASTGPARFGSAEYVAGHEEATSLGARLLKLAEDIESTDGFQVYADPAGHPFCLWWY